MKDDVLARPQLRKCRDALFCSVKGLRGLYETRASFAPQLEDAKGQTQPDSEDNLQGGSGAIIARMWCVGNGKPGTFNPMTWIRCQLLSDRIDQPRRADLQSSGDLNDVVKGDVPLPAFNLGYVIAMNISTIRQLLLADLPLFPQCSDSLPKLNEDIPHPHIVGYMLTIGL